MIERLRELDVFRELGDVRLAALAAHMVSRRLEEGEALFQEGDSGDSVFVIGAGAMAVRKGTRTLAVLHEGQMVGEMAFFDRERRSASAIALVPTEVFGIRNADFLVFLAEHPEGGTQLLFHAVQEMSLRLRQTSEYLTTVFETGRLVGSGLGVEEMSQQILHRLLSDVHDAVGGTVLLYNPYAETFEFGGRLGSPALDLEAATAILEKHPEEDLFQEAGESRVLGVALRGDGLEIIGYVLLEKKGPEALFSTQEEIVVAAVGQQTGLGIRNAYHCEEEAARERLRRTRHEGL